MWREASLNRHKGRNNLLQKRRLKGFAFSCRGVCAFQYFHYCSSIIGESQLDWQIQKTGVGGEGCCSEGSPCTCKLTSCWLVFLYMTSSLGWTSHFVKEALLTEVWRRGKGVGAPEVASQHVQTLGVLCLSGKPHWKPD